MPTGIAITTGLTPAEVAAGEVDHYNDIVLAESEGGPAVRRAVITGGRDPRTIAAAEIYVRRLDLWAKVAIPPHIPAELLRLRGLKVVRAGGFEVRGRVTIDERGARVEFAGAAVPIVSAEVRLEPDSYVEAALVIEDPHLFPEAWPEDLVRRLLAAADWEVA